MKKILSVILVASMMLGIFAVSVSAAETSNSSLVEASMLKIQRIDADSDGKYTLNDAAAFLRAAAGISADAEDAKYDINLDGFNSVADAQQALKIVSGIEPVLTEAETLAFFNEKINSVKTVRPGFEKTETIQCPSIKITTTGGPEGFNVTNLEFDKYVDTIDKLMHTFPYNLALNDEMQAQLNEMKQQAKEIYLPQSTSKTVAARSNSHYSYFPVNNLGWSSKLTVDDIKSATCQVVDDKIVFTVTLPEVTYIGDEYPTGSGGFAKRQTLAYGKVFNIPALDESDGSTVNKVQFKNGKVVLGIDVLTGDVLSADYSYTYFSDVMAAPQKDADGKESKVTMKTATTANIYENYIMNRVTVN